ncbi:MAG TPA: DUF5683 domain-containing protein [Puia sp.]|nr:DUF5683 domain-containing protein [Puia sp.]
MRFFLIIILLSFGFVCVSHAQDTLLIKSKPGSLGDTTVLTKRDTINTALAKKDSLVRQRGPNPRRATIYSAIFPGLGQLYNKKYWKIPIVLAAVGIPTYTYFDNKNWYNKTRYALSVLANGSYNNKDSISKVDPKLIGFIFLDPAHDINPYGLSGLEKYRNYFRSNEDYSVLFFLLFYGLNIVDATVDAHLKLFDVDRDLSIHFGIPSSPSINTYAVSLFVDFHKPQQKLFGYTY